MLDPAQAVGVGGAVGALLRHLVSEVVDAGDYPLGTAAVNVLGSFVLALVSFAAVGGHLGLLLGTGLAGSFTTFSSFSYETVRLWETGKRRHALLHASTMFVGAIAAIGLAHGVVDVLG
ncbi:MAG: CrcB family protein [Halanaeroarchaeum sp.]